MPLTKREIWDNIVKYFHSFIVPLGHNHRGPTRSRAAEKAGLVAYLRRSLSITCVREQARLLLGRLRLLGDGAAEAGRRRARAEQLEAAALREMQAQSVAFLQGRSLRRLGFGRLDI